MVIVCDAVIHFSSDLLGLHLLNARRRVIEEYYPNSLPSRLRLTNSMFFKVIIARRVIPKQI